MWPDKVMKRPFQAPELRPARGLITLLIAAVGADTGNMPFRGQNEAFGQDN
jgi:hypothetical protein